MARPERLKVQASHTTSPPCTEAELGLCGEAVQSGIGDLDSLAQEQAAYLSCPHARLELVLDERWFFSHNARASPRRAP